MNRTVFLDRDGVINRAFVHDGKPYPPLSVDTTEILPGVTDSLHRLHDAGWLLIVVTNQPDVARGIASKGDVEAINRHIQRVLPIDDFRTCYHDNDDACTCRKPLPGSILSAAEAYDIDLTSSYMVGDRWMDIEAGKGAGCRTIFIDYGYSEKQPLGFDHKVCSLEEAAKIILGRYNDKY